MYQIRAREFVWAKHWVIVAAWSVLAGIAGMAAGAPYVEFDFARTAECRDVTPPDCGERYGQGRLMELTLPMSVRFHGLSAADVEEIDIEIDGAAAGLRVFDFSPATQLASDVAQPIETITTTKEAASLDATLGGKLPIPFGDAVAHATPSINGGISGSKTATEKLNRLPPKHAVVVSGTSSEGRGVFFKLKRSSQTSLEGVHLLSVTFVVPADWQVGEARVGCSARGRRKVLWLKQSATLGRAAGTVQIYAAGTAPAHTVAKPVAADAAEAGFNVWPASFLSAADGVAEMVAWPSVAWPTVEWPSAKWLSGDEAADGSAHAYSPTGPAWRPKTARSSESSK